MTVGAEDNIEPAETKVAPVVSGDEAKQEQPEQQPENPETEVKEDKEPESNGNGEVKTEQETVAAAAAAAVPAPAPVPVPVEETNGNAEDVPESEAETEKLDGTEQREQHEDDKDEKDDKDKEEGLAIGMKRSKLDQDSRNNNKKRKINKLQQQIAEGGVANTNNEDTNGSEANGPHEDEDEDEEEEEGGGEASRLAKQQEQEREEAIALLTEIEVEFAKLRDALQHDKMARYVAEIEMCADGTHPELSKVAVQIEAIRDEKVSHAQNQLDYQLGCIDTHVQASRHQLNQQWYKDSAETRADLLTRTTKEWYQVNRERRVMDQMVPDYTFFPPQSRGDQIRQRQLVNDKVSVLAGVGKHVGFPAAPAITGSDREDVDYDLQLMGIR